MNVNYPHPTSTIKDWLTQAVRQLKSAGIESARLDAEIILAHAIEKNRTFLHAHCEAKLSSEFVDNANKLLIKRLNRVPIAYLTGRKEFYGRVFSVDESVLIPRPESEAIIDILHEIIPTKDKVTLFDIGTGSGILGITAKLEFPFIDVTLSDISLAALKIAKKNASSLKANVDIILGNLLEKHSKRPDIIVGNLPYVDSDWPRSPETQFEPSLALFAENNGTIIIERLISEAAEKLSENGYLVIESDPVQHKALTEYAIDKGMDIVKKFDYALAFKKVR